MPQTPNNRRTACTSVWFSKNSQDRHDTEIGFVDYWGKLPEFKQNSDAKLNKFFVEKLPGANIENFKLDARKKIKIIVLDDNIHITWLDVKNLYTNVTENDKISSKMLLFK